MPAPKLRPIYAAVLATLQVVDRPMKLDELTRAIPLVTARGLNDMKDQGLISRSLGRWQPTDLGRQLMGHPQVPAKGPAPAEEPTNLMDHILVALFQQGGQNDENLEIQVGGPISVEVFNRMQDQGLVQVKNGHWFLTVHGAERVRTMQVPKTEATPPLVDELRRPHVPLLYGSIPELRAMSEGSLRRFRKAVANHPFDLVAPEYHHEIDPLVEAGILEHRGLVKGLKDLNGFRLTPLGLKLAKRMIELSSNPIDLQGEIYQLITGSGGRYFIQSGVVHVLAADGREWNFTVPQLADGKSYF